MNTSVEDCKTSLQSVDDIGLLRSLLAECYAAGHKSRGKAVERRLKQVREVA
jgi:hypothetical protein